MRLSPLQKYILLTCLSAKNHRLKRDILANFYDQQKNRPQKELRARIITRSLERLINKELLIGYGIRTPHKWFIREIKLTLKGKKEARRLLGEQGKLPFRALKYKGIKGFHLNS